MAFTHTVTLTVDHTKVPGTLTNYTVKVVGTYADLAATGSGGKSANASGFDIRPYSSALLTTALSYKLLSYNSSTGAIEMDVLVASLSSTADTLIVLALGDATLATDGSSTSAYDANVKARVPVTAPGGTLSVADVSTSGLTFTTEGTTLTASTGATGGAGSAVKTPAASQYAGGHAYSSTSPTLGSTTVFSVGGWVKFNNFRAQDGYPNALFGIGNLTYPYHSRCLAVNGSNQLVACIASDDNGTSKTTSASAALSTGTWYRAWAVYDGSALILYVNGAAAGTIAASALAFTDSLVPLQLNNTLASSGLNPGQRYNDIELDEITVDKVARSANWIAADYNNQSSPSTFYAVGSAVSTGPTKIIQEAIGFRALGGLH